MTLQHQKITSIYHQTTSLFISKTLISKTQLHQCACAIAIILAGSNLSTLALAEETNIPIVGVEPETHIQPIYVEPTDNSKAAATSHTENATMTDAELVAAINAEHNGTASTTAEEENHTDYVTVDDYYQTVIDEYKTEDPAYAAEIEAEYAHYKNATYGPATVNLGDQGKLNVPKDMLFIPKTDANQLMQLWGNSTDPNRYGLVFPNDAQQPWMIDVVFVDAGYIKDDDAKEWDTEAMLTSLKEGNAEQNKVRKEQGLPELATNGWIEKPRYDATNHRLVWSIDVHEKKPSPDAQPFVNYNTYALGREGYINTTLITNTTAIANDKQYANDILAQISYNDGKRYSDFNASTDKVAEYGLAALVGGVAAKKLGLFAIIGAFLAKFAKFILIGVVAFGAAIKKFFTRDKSE